MFKSEIKKFLIYPQKFISNLVGKIYNTCMNGDLYFDGKKYISSSRAAKISGYVNDYIGQLCRDGKLDARMVGRTWYVCLESLIQHKNSNLIGTRSRGPKDVKSLLAEASKAEDILSSKIELGGPSNIEVVTLPNAEPVAEASHPTVVISTPKAPLVSFPEFSSPVSVDIASASGLVYKENISEKKSKVKFGYGVRFGAATIGILFAILGFRFGLSLSPVAQQQYAVVWDEVSSSLPANALGGLGDSVRTKAVAFYNTLRSWISGEKQTVFVMTDPVPASDQYVSSGDMPSTPKEGMVVLPIDESTDKAAVIAKVKNTFSDQVSVSPTDGDNESGVITPVFKKSKGDDYLYVLVPITN